MMYQSMSRNEIPVKVWEEAKIKEENNKMDMIWAHLKGTLTLLSAVALAVLTVPPHGDTISKYKSRYELL